MSPRTEEQFEEIREAKKLLILDISLKLFANNGFHGTTISQIAKEAGISKGLIYNYFDSKDAILLTIVHKGIDSLVQLFDLNKDGELTTDEITYFVDMSFEYLKNNIEYWRLYFSIMLQPSVFAIFKTKIFETLEPLMQTMTNYFKKLGSQTPEVDAIFFGALMDGLSLNYVMNPEMFPLEAIKKKIFDLYT